MPCPDLHACVMRTLQITLVDTAGEERFNQTLTGSHYRNADLVSLTDGEATEWGGGGGAMVLEPGISKSHWFRQVDVQRFCY